MLGVTFFGLLFTPVFFVLVRWLGTLRAGAIPKTLKSGPNDSTAATSFDANRGPSMILPRS
jgi:hypothetical protein